MKRAFVEVHLGRKTIIEAILRPLGFGVYRLKPEAYESNFLSAALRYKKSIVHDLAEKANYTVIRGPFSGLKLPETGAWSDADVLSKIIGSYEAEIFPFLESEISRNPNVVVNIGASEGYYAIGMKRRLPNSDVYTYDIDIKSFSALDYCKKINGVDITRLERFDYNDPLSGISTSNKIKPLFIFDCEGFERNIINFPKNILSISGFIIELHDIFVPNISKSLMEYLSDSHVVTVVTQRGRCLEDYPELAGVRGPIGPLLLDEFRGDTMQWLYAVPK